MIGSPKSLKNLQKKRSLFISLRLKLLFGFTLVFSGVFAGAFWWFYQFSTRAALTRIREDLIDTMKAAVQEIDGDVLVRLSEAAEPRPEGYSDVTEPDYWDHVRWLATVEHVEPRAYVYTYVAGDRPNTVVFIGSGSAANMERDFEGAKFLQYYEPETRIYEGLSETIINDQPYRDQWGYWITGYTPVFNRQGEAVAGLGIDFRAEYVLEVQQNIRRQMVAVFAITYGGLFVLVYVISGVVTRPVAYITKIAERVGEGNYDQDADFLVMANRRIDDEMSILSQVVAMMVSKVREREDKLKQEVAELKIEIDETRRKQQVSEIVDTDFFQDLQSKARTLRHRHRTKDLPLPGASETSEGSGGTLSESSPEQSSAPQPSDRPSDLPEDSTTTEL